VPKFPVPQRERKDFSLKYGETLSALLRKYLLHRLPPEWEFEVSYNPETQEVDEEKLTIRLSTLTSEGRYAASLNLPFTIYVPGKIYVTIPNFSELEEKLLEFIQNSIFESVRPLSMQTPTD